MPESATSIGLLMETARKARGGPGSYRGASGASGNGTGGGGQVGCDADVKSTWPAPRPGDRLAKRVLALSPLEVLGDDRLSLGRLLGVEPRGLARVSLARVPRDAAHALELVCREPVEGAAALVPAWCAKPQNRQQWPRMLPVPRPPSEL